MRKIVALAIALLIVLSCTVIILQLSNQSSCPAPTPASTEISYEVEVTTVTASPSNTTPGLVTVTAEVQNNEAQNKTVLVEMNIQEPNGNMMSIPNSNSTLEIPAGGSKTVTFLPMVQLNTKIGKFNVGIDVYDLQHTTKYYSTGLAYPFTTPIHFSVAFFLWSDINNYSMTVDGVVYNNKWWEDFYWYLGTNHTITVPQTIININPPFVNITYESQFSGWQYTKSENIIENGNTLYVYVAPDTPTYRMMAYYKHQ